MLSCYGVDGFEPGQRNSETGADKKDNCIHQVLDLSAKKKNPPATITDYRRETGFLSSFLRSPHLLKVGAIFVVFLADYRLSGLD